jgi:hypothetical protein
MNDVSKACFAAAKNMSVEKSGISFSFEFTGIPV